jgi:hypothetical protein
VRPRGRARRRRGTSVALRARGRPIFGAAACLARACGTGTLWRRDLLENRFSGSVPPTISALTALTFMCAPTRGRSPPMQRLRRCASAAASPGRPIFGAAACLAVRDQPHVQERLHRPDPREHHGAHPAGRAVRRAAARAVSRPTRACGTGTLRRRDLYGNRFSGSVPPTISALSAVTYLCAPTAALPRGSDERLGKLSQEPLRCRDLVGNRLEGRVPPSLLEMRIPRLLYVPPSVFCSRALRRRAGVCAFAASFRKRAARSRGTAARAKTRTPTTSACAWPGRCAARPSSSCHAFAH